MVLRGKLSPDPSNRPGEDFLPSDVGVIVLTSSDSEDEEVSHEGYEVLPQDFVENNFEADDTDSQVCFDPNNKVKDSNSEKANETNEDENLDLNDSKEISAFDLAMKSELSELWNSENNIRHTDIVMDSIKEEQIKNAMAGFKLPSSAIPPWAEQIPEEEWKKQIINRTTILNKVSMNCE